MESTSQIAECLYDWSLLFPRSIALTDRRTATGLSSGAYGGKQHVLFFSSISLRNVFNLLDLRHEVLPKYHEPAVLAAHSCQGVDVVLRGGLVAEQQYSAPSPGAPNKWNLSREGALATADVLRVTIRARGSIQICRRPRLRPGSCNLCYGSTRRAFRLFLNAFLSSSDAALGAGVSACVLEPHAARHLLHGARHVLPPVLVGGVPDSIFQVSGRDFSTSGQVSTSSRGGGSGMISGNNAPAYPRWGAEHRPGRVCQTNSIQTQTPSRHA